MDPPLPPFDRDPLQVDEEPVPRRLTPEPDDSGMVVVYAVAAVLILLMFVAVLSLAASRSGQTTDPVDVSGTSSAAQSGTPRP
jgi:hypothetical protein